MVVSSYSFLLLSMFPSLRNQSSWVLLFVRIVLAAVFILHGYQKWSIWSGVPEGMPSWLAVVFQILSIVEPLAGVLLLVGIVVEWAALATAIIMVGAIWFKMSYLAIPFAAGNTTGWEFDLTNLALSLVILGFGAGSLSLKTMMKSPAKKK